jgi:hypothetical protein
MTRVLAYIVAGIPAAIGIAFVARYAFVTSDAAIDGLATAFLFAMVAAGAFLGPALCVAVAGNSKRLAAVVLGVLTALAILTNWTHTLGAIAHRSAGTEAEAAKAVEARKDDRAELARMLDARKALPAYTPATADDVAAARAAVEAAEASRKAECGRRGPFCRARETAEQGKRDALSAILARKAATDRAAKLDSDAATIRKRLASAPAVREANPLGEALARLLPWLPAASAATIQQAVVSAIAELLIAAGLALPELLRRNGPGDAGNGIRTRESVSEAPKVPPDGEAIPDAPAQPAPRCAVQPSIAGVRLKPVAKPAEKGSVAKFMLACLPRAKGEGVALASVYRRYVRWCEEQAPAVAPEDAASFGESFKGLANKVRLGVEKRGGKVYIRDVRLVA